MAKRVIRQSREQKLLRVWWVCALLAVVFLGLSYGFVSLAIDSGNFLQWMIGFFFFGWAFVQLVRSVRFAFDR